MLTRSSANRGSTYTFVAAGRAEVSTLEQNTQSSSASLPPPTLRQLLQRLDVENVSTITLNSVTSVLPSVIDVNAPRDPILAGIVSEERMRHLFDYFNQHLSPWLAVLDPTLHPAAIDSPFLLSTILLQASKFSGLVDPTRPDETSSLEAHCRTLAALAFLEADTRQEVALAFYIMSAWKTPDDAFTDMYTGFADRIDIISRKGTARGGSDMRSRERIHLFHYVQQNVFTLHYGPSTTFSKRNDLVRQALPWSQAKDSLISDWFLCADVESTAIQCRYKSLFEEHQYQHGATYTPLLEVFLQELQSWEDRWRGEASRREGREKGTAGKHLRLTGLKLFRNSVCTQMSSIALCETLRAWLRGRQMDSPAHVKRSYDLCLDSCMGVLESILDVGNQLETLLHIPDSLILLADHAAMLAVYLLLVPAVTADQDIASLNKTTIDRVSDVVAQGCIDRIKRVKDIIEAASSLRSHVNTSLTLSADYLDSIIGLIEGRTAEQEVQHTVDGLLPIDPAASLSIDVFDLGWDWLQSFLNAPLV